MAHRTHALSEDKVWVDPPGRCPLVIASELIGMDIRYTKVKVIAFGVSGFSAGSDSLAYGDRLTLGNKDLIQVGGDGAVAVRMFDPNVSSETSGVVPGT